MRAVIGIYNLIVGMLITLKTLFTKPTTIQYPDEKYVVSGRYRGALKLLGTIDQLDFSNAPKRWSETDDERLLPPCQRGCPARVRVRDYIYLVSDRKFLEAVDKVRESNPLASICGRACFHPCEGQCRRGHYGDPVAIDSIKRFAADYERKLKREGKLPVSPKPAPKNKKVAVVGAGPAGLTVAYYLSKEGFQVTVYESENVLGGMLVMGIPAYRLPRDVIKDELDILLKNDVIVKTGMTLGGNLKLNELTEGYYDAVFLGVGAQSPQKLGVEGEEIKGVYAGEDFLKKANLGQEFKIGNKVAVIGAGNTAIDSARVALRKGAKEVRVVYRRSRAEMPAHEVEVRDAEEEGVEFVFLTAPTKVIGDNGRVVAMECQKMQLGAPDASGRRRPEPVKGSEFVMEVDNIFPAISRIPDLSYIPKDSGIEISKRSTISVNKDTGETTKKGVFAGGDVVNGAATIIDAVAGARTAASGIMRYLS